ncbi:MAG: serine protease [Bdellovibrionales bacterium]|nr:serine protease [Bdellovibrionales bacterium]
MVKLVIAHQRILLLLWICVGCAHPIPNRKPAEVTQASPPVAESDCTTAEQEFEEIEKLKEVMISLPTKLRQSLDTDRKNQREHMRYFESLRVRGRTCDDYAKIKQAVEIAKGRLIDINKRLSEYKNQLDMGKKLRGLTQLRISNEKIFCIMDCEDEARRSDRAFCANRCGTTPSQAQVIHSLFIGEDSGAPDTCPETPAENKQKLKLALGEVLDIIRASANRSEPVVSRALREYAEIKSFYEREQKKYEQMLIRFQGSECLRQDQNLTGSLEENVRRAWSFGERGHGQGTIYYVQGSRAGEGIPVTAQHVSGIGDQGRPARGRFAVVERNQEAERLDQQSGDVPSLVRRRMVEGNAEVFPVQPGSYDASQDVTLGEARTVNFALPLVEAERRPQIGQRFVIAGFPGNRESNFTTHRCVFRGYTDLADGRPNAGYLIYCPSAESLVSGMSGGPMVDESGKVWGTIHAGDTGNRGLVIVTPMARSAQGDVQIGIRQPMLSDHCYRLTEQSTERHRCQVFPNSRETQVP